LSVAAVIAIGEKEPEKWRNLKKAFLTHKTKKEFFCCTY
jgi:hypothetical protein